MFRIDRKVYKCDLLSITPDIKVEVDKSKRDNLYGAKVEPVMEVMVEPTLGELAFREVATKKIIPAYKISNREDYYENYKGITDVSVPKSACFIKFEETEEYGDYIGNTLVPATQEEVKEYLEVHKSPDGTYKDFMQELDSVFLQAEQYYNEAKNRGELSDRKAIKEMIRSLRKK